MLDQSTISVHPTQASAATTIGAALLGLLLVLPGRIGQHLFPAGEGPLMVSFPLSDCDKHGCGPAQSCIVPQGFDSSVYLDREIPPRRRGWSSVDIATSPAGAAVFIDGHLLPTGTPIARIGVPPGRHRIVLALKGHRIEHFDIRTMLEEQLKIVHILRPANSPNEDIQVCSKSEGNCSDLSQLVTK